MIKNWKDVAGFLCCAAVVLAGAWLAWAYWTGWIYTLPAWRMEWIG